MRCNSKRSLSTPDLEEDSCHRDLYPRLSAFLGRSGRRSPGCREQEWLSATAQPEPPVSQGEKSNRHFLPAPNPGCEVCALALTEECGAAAQCTSDIYSRCQPAGSDRGVKQPKGSAVVRQLLSCSPIPWHVHQCAEGSRVICKSIKSLPRVRTLLRQSRYSMFLIPTYSGFHTGKLQTSGKINRIRQYKHEFKHLKMDFKGIVGVPYSGNMVTLGDGHEPSVWLCFPTCSLSAWVLL